MLENRQTDGRNLPPVYDNKTLSRILGLPDITCGLPMPFPVEELFGSGFALVDFHRLDERIDHAIEQLIALRDALDDTDGDLDIDDENDRHRWLANFRHKRGGRRPSKPGSEEPDEVAIDPSEWRHPQGDSEPLLGWSEGAGQAQDRITAEALSVAGRSDEAEADDEAEEDDPAEIDDQDGVDHWDICPGDSPEIDAQARAANACSPSSRLFPSGSLEGRS